MVTAVKVPILVSCSRAIPQARIQSIKNNDKPTALNSSLDDTTTSPGTERPTKRRVVIDDDESDGSVGLKEKIPSCDEVNDLFQVWSSAIASSDPEQVANLYTKSAVLRAPQSDVLHVGHKSIKTYFVDFLKRKRSVEIHQSKVTVDVEWCKDEGTYEVTTVETGDRELLRYCFVYERENGGQWKINHHHSSIPQQVTSDDFRTMIDNAEKVGRIDDKKAARMRGLLGSDSWADIAFNYACELIPNKRNGGGYKCKVCKVPAKGHSCLYCPMCSTADVKHLKEGHDCVYCMACFDAGKKRKKEVKVLKEGHECPHRGSKEAS